MDDSLLSDSDLDVHREIEDSLIIPPSDHDDESSSSDIYYDGDSLIASGGRLKASSDNDDSSVIASGGMLKASIDNDDSSVIASGGRLKASSDNDDSSVIASGGRLKASSDNDDSSVIASGGRLKASSGNDDSTLALESPGSDEDEDDNGDDNDKIITEDTSDSSVAEELIESCDSDSSGPEIISPAGSPSSPMPVQNINSSNDSSEDYMSAVADSPFVKKGDGRSVGGLKGQSERRPLTPLPESDADKSLCNTPPGARMVQTSSDRDVADIVAELSQLKIEINVKEALFESLNTENIPDKGKNLIKLISEMKQKKAELEKELSNSKELQDQKRELKEFEGKINRPYVPTKQTTLNFEPSTEVKSEAFSNYRSEVFDVSDDDIPSSSQKPLFRDVSNFNSTSTASEMPEFGALPRPDMTISNFGKKAMQTHLTEKTLTLESLSKLHNALKSCPSESTLAEDPAGLKVDLMPHQKHGLAWMMWREKERPSGGILADDMGLGKTLSMIALILKSYEGDGDSSDSESDSENDSPHGWMRSKTSRMPKGGTLVVCPATLIAQWEREVHKRVKRKLLSVELYHGNKREKRAKRLASYDIVITTYQLMSRESGVETAKNATVMKEKGPLHQIKWERVILDEAHVVRNHKSLMALGVCELAAKHRWCLTGTPIHNKELDLYALLKFLKCSPFDDLTVWKRWVDNKNAAGMQRLNTMMKSLMLRRTKEQLQQSGDLNCLPDKSFEIIDVHLDPEELELYEKVSVFSRTLFAQFLHQRAEKQQALDARYGTCNLPSWQRGDEPDNNFKSNEELATMYQRMHGIKDIKTHDILVLLLRLRQICCHPGLVKKMVESGQLDLEGAEENVDGLDADLFDKMNNLNIEDEQFNEEMVQEEKQKYAEIISVNNPILKFERPSAKIRAVMDVLEEKIIDSDDKAIVVSQWTSVLDILTGFLVEKGVKFDKLTGAVPVNMRQDIVNKFNRPGSGPQVLLLSLTAGGVGLNLVGANHLLLIDIHWNPQLEAQACDRIYRVGQKKSVFVYRFITIDTIEERIKNLQDHKLALADSVLTGTRNTEASKLTLDDLKMLFAAPTMPQPQADPVHLH